MFMIFRGASGNINDLPKPFCLSLVPQIYSNRIKTNKSNFCFFCLYNPHLGSRDIRKSRVVNSLTLVSSILENREYGININKNTHNMRITKKLSRPTNRQELVGVWGPETPPIIVLWKQARNQ